MSWHLDKKSAAWLLPIPVMAIASLYVPPIPAIKLISSDAVWTSDGGFQIGSVFPTTQFQRPLSDHERASVTFWGSWRGTDTSTGELRSPVFDAPRILEAFVAGYPGQPGLGIFLERQDNHTRVPLFTEAGPGERWRRLHWWVPSDLRGHRVRLVAVDNATNPKGWLGISTPAGTSLVRVIQQEIPSAARMIFLFLANFILFLFPGFALASALPARRPMNIPCVLALVIATGATLGYISFWAFFGATLLGRIWSCAVYSVSAGLSVISLRRGSSSKESAKLIGEPFLYAAFAGLCYLCFLFLFVDPLGTGASHANVRFFEQVRPGDNVIPLILAEKIYAHKPLVPFCCGDWLSSDRPPLQAGIYLLLRPFRLTANSNLNYELIAAALQCLWIWGVFSFLKSLGVERFRMRQVLGILIFSGFLFCNSVYTWPKLLAAAFILLISGILCDVIRTQHPITSFESALAALCLGLTLMAHSGSAFSLPVLAVLLVRFRRFLPLRKIALAVPILLGFILPWSAYQKFVDPPGNRLLKMHLAGVGGIDNRSTWQSLKDSYRSHTLSEIASFKESNLALIAGRKFLDTFGMNNFSRRGGLHIDPAADESSRIAQREWIWNAVGVANFGWPAAVFVLLKRRRPAIPYAGWMIAAALTDFVIWSLVTFGPSETVTTHSSFADILLLSVGLLGFLLALPRFVALLVFALQAFNFFIVWAWSPPGALSIGSQRILAPLPQLSMLFFGTLFAVVLLWYFGGSYFGAAVDSSIRSSSEVRHHI